MSNLLTYDPGVKVVVKKDRTGEKAIAVADEDGVVRNEKGQSYSAGAYSIVTEDVLDD